MPLFDMREMLNWKYPQLHAKIRKSTPHVWQNAQVDEHSHRVWPYNPSVLTESDWQEWWEVLPFITVYVLSVRNMLLYNANSKKRQLEREGMSRQTFRPCLVTQPLLLFSSVVLFLKLHQAWQGNETRIYKITTRKCNPRRTDNPRLSRIDQNYRSYGIFSMENIGVSLVWRLRRNLSLLASEQGFLLTHFVLLSSADRFIL